MIFADRNEAGQKLAECLAKFAAEQPVVYALPRGGLPVGFAVAKRLGCPLDVILVRKIRAPFQPELALGAVVDGAYPEIVLNDLGGLEPTEEALKAAAAVELQEIERRRRTYLAGRKQIPATGRTAIIVDDGLATGATARAAIRALRRQDPKRLVLAVPVAPADTKTDLSREVDELICLETPAGFDAVGSFYRDFSQVSDQEAVAILAAAREMQEDKKL
ncbi:phosphoribosyltransferase [Dongia sp.]|uniref:phosphoribosyltransferase n=1 Tax=Dongia sp. TaxID=1977262 RepID=UPI0035B1DC8C